MTTPDGTSTTATEKRMGDRAAVSVQLSVTGQCGSYAAQTVDISRTGALIWISDESFIPPVDAHNIVYFSERVAAELGGAMKLHFLDRVEREADVVRITRKDRDDSSPMLVACAFDPLSDEEWQSLGLDPSLTVVQSRPPVEMVTRSKAELPVGAVERRRHPRVDKIWMAEVSCDYGTYQAYVINTSASGALLTLADPEFAPPVQPDKLVLFTKRMGFQFRNGITLRFLDARVIVQADVVRVSERTEGIELIVVIGVRFRKLLDANEATRLEVEPPRADDLALPAASADPDLSGTTRIRELMAQAAHSGASDVHVKVGSPVRLRVNRQLIVAGNLVVSPEEAEAMAMEIMEPAQARRFAEKGDVEFVHNIEGVGRFRCAAFRQRGTTSLAIRIIPDDIPDFAALGLSDVARRMAEMPHGLVLVTGPSGAGKSHTLAAMVDHINRTRSCHILTLEDPIEFLYRDHRAHISQREVGRDCETFHESLKRALRQDPDVILVGEMRDLETTQLALTAAETGQLVLATLHTTSAVNTPSRIIDIFPPRQQTQVRQQLADSLQGVMSQLLLPRREGGVVLASEILVASEAVRALLRDNKIAQLRNIMQTSGKEGMQTMESALNALVRRGIISYETAIARATFPKEIERKGGRPRK